MPNDRTNSGDVRAELPEASGTLRPPLPAFEPNTLAGRLVPVADRLRNLLARTGVRIYRVYIVHAYWTGPRRGVGKQIITSRREILPIPRVRDLNAVRRNLASSGLYEEGDLIVDQISGKYTEDDLTCRTPDNVAPAIPRTSLKTVEFWYEVQENRPSTPPPPIRRFSPPAATPMLSRSGLSWTIVLTRQAEDRGRRGEDPGVSVE